MPQMRYGSAQTLRGACLTVLTVACVTAAAQQPIEVTLSARWTEAYNGGDAAALGAIYAPDARLVHGYCPPVDGRDAIEEYWRVDLGGGGLSTRLNIADTFSSGDVTYISGTYTVTQESEPGEISGRYTQIWRRDEHAGWTLYRESWLNLACLEIRGPRRPAVGASHSA